MALTWKTQYPAMHNSPEGQMTAGISDTDLEIPVDYLEFYPEDEFLLVIDPANADWEYPETVRCEGIVSGSSGAGNLTVLDRGFNALGDTGKARSWLISTRVIVTFTARHLTNIIDDLDYCKNPLSDQSIAITQLAEGKVFIDDFSNDTSDNYTEDVGDYTWDPANGKITVDSTTDPKIIHDISNYDAIELITTIEINKCTGIIFNYIDADNYYSFYLFGFDAGRYKILKRVNGVQSNVDSGAIALSYSDVTAQLLKLVVLGTQVKFYYNANNFVTKTIELTGTCGIGIDTLTGNTYATKATIYGLYVYPQISDSDDFATDTSANWAAVVGTTNYDAVNNNLDLITASGAGLKGQYRRRSYLNEEGGQKINVILPTGADGDHFALITHASSADMTDGIGAGLHSNGIGGWHFVTFDGTTISNEGLSSLSDADVATIEIAKNIQGEYWYWIYDSAGVKPTTPTGKLFTTLARGFTGFYCNGAGGTTQTFTIDAFECRCNTVVGDTNCESEEAFFLRDDFTVDSSERWTAIATNVDTVKSVTGGELVFSSVTGVSKGWTRLSEKVLAMTLDLDFTFETTDYAFIGFSVDGTYNATMAPQNGYTIQIAQGSSNNLKIERRDSVGAATALETGSKTINAATQYHLQVIWDSSTGSISVEFNSDGLPIVATDTTYLNGYIGIRSAITAASGEMSFDELQISGTRSYPSPMLRGTQIGLYADGV